MSCESLHLQTKTCKLGLIARADTTGLSAQTHAVWQHLRPTATLVVDMDHVRGVKTVPTDISRFPGARPWVPAGFPAPISARDATVDDFLRAVDVVYTAETPYNYYVFERARELGVKTVLHANPEFLDYWVHPELPRPDVVALPTRWYMREISELLAPTPVLLLPVPVPAVPTPARLVRCRRLLHLAGVQPARDRNGTQILLHAMPSVSPLAHLRVVSHGSVGDVPRNVIVDTSPYRWPRQAPAADLMVIPRRFGGLCLPMQESLARGVPVLMSAVEPQASVLPPGLLVTASPGESYQAARLRVTLQDVSPELLAARINELVDSPGELRELAAWARAWARANSWVALHHMYLELLA